MFLPAIIGTGLAMKEMEGRYVMTSTAPIRLNRWIIPEFLLSVWTRKHHRFVHSLDLAYLDRPRNGKRTLCIVVVFKPHVSPNQRSEFMQCFNKYCRTESQALLLNLA